MLKICGKTVIFQGKRGRKTIAQLSTVFAPHLLAGTVNKVQVAALHSFTLIPPQHLSTPFFRSLPLGEHYFYPVSTAPTITFIKGKRKERQ